MSRYAHRHRAPLRASGLRSPASRLPRGLTLIEMLVATAITLLMMAAVVNLFANLTGSIRNRRAVIELSGQLRQTRQRLSLDLAGATCPAVPWQPPGADKGYLEIIEGKWSDQQPSVLVDGDANNGEVDYATTIIPSSQLIDPDVVRTDGRSLGDYDDILALTVRSDGEPFVAQINGNKVESPLAEVVWFAVENPANGLLGEPGLRSIYRRALVIAPGRPNLQFISGPPDSQWFFQRYDISAHYDPTYDTNNDGTPDGAWIPNTLSDLTRRENRCYRQSDSGPVSPFPHLMATGGAGYSDDANVDIVRTNLDTASGNARATALLDTDSVINAGSMISYVIADGGTYDDLPSATVNGPGLKATARPVLAQVSKNPDQWRVAQITFGPAPLSIHRVPLSGGGSFIVDRTGEDLMLADALAFDLRVYDPGAPVYGTPIASNPNSAVVLVQPGDPGWGDQANPASFGAYVDMGWRPDDRYDRDLLSKGPALPRQVFDFPHQAGWNPRYIDNTMYPYGWPAVYDTWSLHYESDGIDQDGDGRIDQGENDLDDDVPAGSGQFFNGPDDALERETSPPYDAPLRGLQVRLRVYERDARQIRETSVTRSLVP